MSNAGWSTGIGVHRLGRWRDLEAERQLCERRRRTNFEQREVIELPFALELEDAIGARQVRRDVGEGARGILPVEGELLGGQVIQALRAPLALHRNEAM